MPHSMPVPELRTSKSTAEGITNARRDDCAEGDSFALATDTTDFGGWGGKAGRAGRVELGIVAGVDGMNSSVGGWR